MPVARLPGRFRARGMLLASLLLAAPPPAPSLAAGPATSAATGMEELLLGVTLNDEDKGSFFAYREADGDLLFAVGDLREMGFRPLPLEPRNVGGEPHVSLRSLGVPFDFDPGAVAVRITAPPELLAVTVIDFSRRTGEEVDHPSGRSAFLNYGVAARGGEGYDAPDIEAGAEAAFRSGDWLLFSDGIYRGTREQDGFVRLQTRATWEDRAARERLTLGDQTLSAGELWAAPAVGGVSFARIHRIDPYLVSHPMFGLAGQTPIPAEVRIYLDGVLVRTEKVSPGEFEVRDLDAYGGDRRVEVVVRDAFGRETRYERPFYFTDSVLRRGLHEFSYGLGWLREDYGESSGDYGRAALSAFHRYGVTDAVTLGAAGEAGDGVVSAGPTLSLVAGRYGTVSLALSAGRMDGEAGWAGVASHEYETKRVTTRARLLHSSAQYRTLLDEDASERAGTELDLGVSYGTAALGTFSLAWRSRWLDAGEDRTRLGLDYRLGLHGKVSIFAALAQVAQAGDRWVEAIAGVSYFPGRQQTVSVQYARQQDADTTTLEVSQDRTEGSGLAWRALAQRRGDDTALRPSLEYRGGRGILAAGADLRSGDGGGMEGTYDFSASGSLVAAGGFVGLSRPIADAFAVVQVGRGTGLPGVRVYQGGSDRGVTGADGSLILPEVGSYVHNQISIEPKDIPLDYSIERVLRLVSPAERGGALVAFDAARYQAVAGRIVLVEGERRRPLEFVEVTVTAGGRSWTVPSGRDGDIFLENAGAGPVVLSFRDRGRERSCAAVIPESEEVIVDIGEVSCAIEP